MHYPSTYQIRYDNTPHIVANNITNIVENLENYASSTFKWFANN